MAQKQKSNESAGQAEKAYRFPCPVHKKCGGCQLTNLRYAGQLSYKQARCIKLLGRFGHVEEILSTGRPFYYRNKVQAAFGRTRSGQIISGVYQSSTHNIVKVDSCLLEDKRADKIIVDIRNLITAFSLGIYNENTGEGFLRHVLVKVARGTGEVMVVLVTGTPVFKSKNAFLEALIKKHPEITTVVQSVNDRFTSLVLGDEEHVLYGEGTITDELMGKRFVISPRSFYQINYDGTQILYKKALEYADIGKDDVVMDAYAGVGTIGILASDRAKEVLSVELNPDAVKDAKLNARLNGVTNVRFICADASEAAEKLEKNGVKPDVVIIDPPRKGCDMRCLETMAAIRPSRIVYVSCDPFTLARDVEKFTEFGYAVNSVKPVNLFPRTEHVETVTLITRAG